MSKRQVTKRSRPGGRGIQLISARIVEVKTDFDGLVRQLRKFSFPNLFTLDDLLPICGLKTQADRIHLARALRRGGVMPLRRKKIALTDIVSRKRVRAYVWPVGTRLNYRTDSDVRREYARQHHIDLIAKAQAARLGFD